MSIERNLRQTQWGAMRTDVQWYFIRLSPEIYFADRAPMTARTFHLEREDMGNAFSDGINNETYYQTGIRGVQDLGKPVFVGYATYPESVGNISINFIIWF